MSDQSNTTRKALRPTAKLPLVRHSGADSYELIFHKLPDEIVIEVNYERCRAIIDSFLAGTASQRERRVEEIIFDAEFYAGKPLNQIGDEALLDKQQESGVGL